MLRGRRRLHPCWDWAARVRDHVGRRKAATIVLRMTARPVGSAMLLRGFYDCAEPNSGRISAWWRMLIVIAEPPTGW